MKKEIDKAKKAVKDAAKVAVGVKVAADVSKEATKVVTAVKTVKKIEKKLNKKTEIVPIKMNSDLKKKLDAYCKNNKISKNKVILKAIEEYIR